MNKPIRAVAATMPILRNSGRCLTLTRRSGDDHGCRNHKPCLRTNVHSSDVRRCPEWSRTTTLEQSGDSPPPPLPSSNRSALSCPQVSDIGNRKQRDKRPENVGKQWPQSLLVKVRRRLWYLVGPTRLSVVQPVRQVADGGDLPPGAARRRQNEAPRSLTASAAPIPMRGCGNGAARGGDRSPRRLR